MKTERQIQIDEFLEEHPEEVFSATEIAERLGLTNHENVTSSLTQDDDIVKRYIDGKAYFQLKKNLEK